MSQQSTGINRAGLGLCFALFLFLTSIYLATYSGRIESSDSLRVVDAASSLVHFGDLRRDESLWQEAPRVIPVDIAFPFSIYEPQEPLIAYAAAIPYSLATILPQLGFVHATWLLNIIIAALSVVLFYLLARMLNYETKTALIATILLGIGTIVWAYSKTLFRDPLVMPFLLMTAIFLEYWRRDYRRIWWLIIAILAFIGAYYTKNSSLVALPAFAIWLLPQWQVNKTVQAILDGLLVLGLVLLVSIAFLPSAFNIFADLARPLISVDTSFARIALHSYLFSIGGSIWGSSPILLAGIIGSLILIRQNQRRLLWAVLALIIAYALGHAMLSRVHWFGGLSLPPRFMLPTIPFAMLLTLPVIEHLFQNVESLHAQTRLNWLWRISFVGLAVCSIIIQTIFSISLMDAYVELIPPEANGLVEWLPGLNQFEYLRWRLLPQSWNSLGWDVAWTRIDLAYIGVLFVILAIVSGISLITRKYRTGLNIGLTIGIILVSGIGFQQLYQRDAQYWATTPELFEVLTILEDESEAIEPLFLAGSADVTYERFILNYLNVNTVRPVVIGFQPGERTSPSDPPSIQSSFNADLLSVTMLRYIDRVIASHERFWWLAHNSLFTEWALRPEERYFAENYYLLHEHTTDNPTVRLFEFSSVQAPNPYGFRLPDYSSDARFGDHITLEGYSLPLGALYSAGDIVPITFYWQSDASLDIDYTVSWFLVNETGYFLQGIDSAPNAGFSPTTSWEVNQLVLDNRAIEIPSDAPTGEYQIWLRLYARDAGGEELLPVSGGETFEGTTAILPIRVQLDSTN